MLSPLEPNAALGSALPQVPAAPPPDIEYAETVEKGHGRIVARHLALSREVAPHLCWLGAAQVCRIERTRERAGPEALLTLVREHWGIENRRHYRRDIALREDAIRVRTGNAPQAIAAL